MELHNQQQIRVKDLDEWLNSHCTRKFLELIKERRESSFQYINLAALHIEDIKKLDLYEVSKYKGEIAALDKILDLKEFLLEVTEIPKEESSDEEAYSVGRESNS